MFNMKQAPLDADAVLLVTLSALRRYLVATQEDSDEAEVHFGSVSGSCNPRQRLKAMRLV